MMVVHKSRSVLPSTKRPMTSSSSRSFMRPWATSRRRLGKSLRSRRACLWMLWIRLCTQNTCPPRAFSRNTAPRTRLSDQGETTVSTGLRWWGGVARTERSRYPPRARCRVRGMGVAERRSTSAAGKAARHFSLWRTPKRCSSSTIRSPIRANRTSPLRSRWVPMTTSTFPSARAPSTSFCSASVRKRERTSTRRGKGDRRSRKV